MQTENIFSTQMLNQFVWLSPYISAMVGNCNYKFKLFPGDW